MKQHIVKILQAEYVTHDVKRFVVEKPKGYKNTAGQVLNMAINKPGWDSKFRPFTYTSTEYDLILEFMIKIYPEHKGVTEQMQTLVPGDSFIITEPRSTITYRGPGVFIAGGAGVTPFLSMLRKLKKEGKLNGHSLIVSNKTEQDIIAEHELGALFGQMQDRLIFTLTREELAGYEHGRVDENFLRKYITDFTQYFYLCGPPQFMQAMRDALEKLGAKSEGIEM